MATDAVADSPVRLNYSPGMRMQRPQAFAQQFELLAVLLGSISKVNCASRSMIAARKARASAA